MNPVHHLRNIFNLCLAIGLLTTALALIFAAGIVQGLFVAIAPLVTQACKSIVLLARALHRMRDTVLLCVVLACAWAAANIDDPAPAVTIATASR